MDKRVSFIAYPAFQGVAYEHDDKDYIVISGGSGHEYGQPYVISTYMLQWDPKLGKYGLPSDHYRGLVASNDVENSSWISYTDQIIQSSMFTTGHVSAMYRSDERKISDLIFLAYSDKLHIYRIDPSTGYQQVRVSTFHQNLNHALERITVRCDQSNVAVVYGISRTGHLSCWLVDLESYAMQKVYIDRPVVPLSTTDQIVSLHHTGATSNRGVQLCIYTREANIWKYSVSDDPSYLSEPRKVEFDYGQSSDSNLEISLKDTRKLGNRVLLIGTMWTGDGPRKCREYHGVLLCHENEDVKVMSLEKKFGHPSCIIENPKKKITYLACSKSLLTIHMDDKKCSAVHMTDLVVHDLVDTSFPPQCGLYLPNLDAICVIYSNYTLMYVSLKTSSTARQLKQLYSNGKYILLAMIVAFYLIISQS